MCRGFFVGCNRYVVTRPVDKDGKFQDGLYIDENQVRELEPSEGENLVHLAAEAASAPPSQRGGPTVIIPATATHIARPPAQIARPLGH
jgi:hypothetical protein